MTRRPALCLNLYLRSRRVLLVGSGPGADERASRLHACDAQLSRLDEDAWRSGARGERDDFFVVIAHSADDELNAEVARWATGCGALAYAHDQPDVSDFSFPALSTHGPLAIAIATQGAAPALAGHLRRELDGLLDRSRDVLDGVIAELERVRSQEPPGLARMQSLKAIAGRVRLVGKLELRAGDASPDA